MNGVLDYTPEERKLPKMRCTYGTIKHSHSKQQQPIDSIPECNENDSPGRRQSNNVALLPPLTNFR